MPSDLDHQLEPPDAVHLQQQPDGPLRAAHGGPGRWTAGAAVVDLTQGDDHGLQVRLSSAEELSRVVLRWRRRAAEQLLVSGDAWERSYGELGWQHVVPERVLPWYWIGWDPVTGRSCGYGVDVRPGAMCSWTVDRAGINLWLDVRNGGSALSPTDRALSLATVRAVAGPAPPQLVREALVTSMASPVDPPSRVPLVGANNWNYAYGVGFDRDAVLTDARTVVELCDGHPVRPFSVIDDGWNPGGPGSGGPWESGTAGLFDDMAEVAATVESIGARPGLWFRPLRSRDEADRALATARPDTDHGLALDPSHPAVLERVVADVTRFRQWGYELLKHDFSTFDVLGRFGATMGITLTESGWRFADPHRTTAEVLRDLYDAIRTAVPDMTLLGCNTVGHLAAGSVDAQRIGDDTSGRCWERTRRIGINAHAFRLAQHGRFFTTDSDCVSCTPHVPWELDRQYLDLVARSGTALFVSVDPRARTSRTDADLAAAIRIALDGATPSGPADVRPLDELTSSTPESWQFGDHRADYRWSAEAGVWPFPV